jgi:hypothetical protein
MLTDHYNEVPKPHRILNPRLSGAPDNPLRASLSISSSDIETWSTDSQRAQPERDISSVGVFSWTSFHWITDIARTTYGGNGQQVDLNEMSFITYFCCHVACET